MFNRAPTPTDGRARANEPGNFSPDNRLISSLPDRSQAAATTHTGCPKSPDAHQLARIIACYSRQTSDPADGACVASSAGDPLAANDVGGCTGRTLVECGCCFNQSIKIMARGNGCAADVVVLLWLLPPASFQHCLSGVTRRSDCAACLLVADGGGEQHRCRGLAGKYV